MQIETILSGVASIIAIAISGWSLYISRRAASIANGQLELQMRDSISQAKRYIDEATRSLEQKNTKARRAILRHSWEQLSNAYEEASAKYLDGKMDRRERFKRMYRNEITSHVRNKAIKDKYTEPQTLYHATVKVYSEWNNPE